MRLMSMINKQAVRKARRVFEVVILWSLATKFATINY